MSNSRIAQLEERVRLIEAFLDAELRQRQHLAERDCPGGIGTINPWYGCELGLVRQPIGVRPITSESPDRGT